jgi:hypothetical protein
LRSADGAQILEIVAIVAIVAENVFASFVNEVFKTDPRLPR